MLLHNNQYICEGGMLTQKLDLSDLHMEKGTFDGTMS